MKKICLLCALFLYKFAIAQPPIEHIDPSRVEGKPIKALIPNEQQDAVRLEKLSDSAPLSSQIHFKLRDIRIEGAKVFASNSFKDLYINKIGQDITLNDLQMIARAITQRYREHGYLISQALVPPQRIEKGVAKIIVIEGDIDQVQIEGFIPPITRSLVEKYGKKIQSTKPIHKASLERYALLADDIPGLVVRALLKPASSKGGASDLIMLSESDSFDAFLTFDNRISRRYGYQQLTAQAAVNHLLPGSRTAVTGKVSTEYHRMRIFNIIHSQYLGSDGTKLTLLAQHTHTHPNVTPEGFNNFIADGDSTMYNVNLSYPLIRSRQKTWTVEGEIDFQQSNSSTQMIGNIPRSVNDRIRSIRLGTSLEFLDDWWGSNLLSTELSQGLNAFDAKGMSRQDGRIEYTKINAEVSRLQLLPQHFSFLITIQGQAAFNSLLSPEEFGIGGTHIGRGFDNSEIVGDDGLASKLELRYNSQLHNNLFNQLQFYGFFDSGVVWNKRVVFGQKKSEHLLSAGIGARVNIYKHCNIGMELAQPINKDIAAVRNRDPRFFFTISAFV